MAFCGKWSLKEMSGAKAYFDAIKSPDEHKEKLTKLADLVKQDASAYFEELTVENNKLKRVVHINGETKKDSGDVQMGVEHDAKAADGRPAKVKLVLDSDSKITRYENGEGFSTVTTYEVSGDTLVIKATGNGATMVSKYQRV